MIDTQWIAGGALLSHPPSPGAEPRYRFSLERWWQSNGRFALWVMLNPSTGSASTDDRTIRRCVERTKSFPGDLGGLRIANLFAWRNAKPSALAPLGFDVAVGNPYNDDMLRILSASSEVTVVGWGSSSDVPGDWLDHRERDMDHLLTSPQCLGLTVGRPRHPAPRIEKQLPLTTGLQPWHAAS
jgi:hypothetical protein